MWWGVPTYLLYSHSYLNIKYFSLLATSFCQVYVSEMEITMVWTIPMLHCMHCESVFVQITCVIASIFKPWHCTVASHTIWSNFVIFGQNRLSNIFNKVDVEVVFLSLSPLLFFLFSFGYVVSPFYGRFASAPLKHHTKILFIDLPYD